LQRLEIDDPSLGWLRGIAKHSWLTTSLRFKAALREIRTLNGAGIPVVLLKGAALSARWPEAIEMRLSGDVDILVPQERTLDALRLLGEAGWLVPPPNFVSATDLQKFHAFGVCRHPNLWVDVHWRPSSGIGDPALGREVLLRSREAELHGTRVRIPDIADHLFILLAHAFFSAAETRLDWVAEASLIFETAKADVEWLRLDELVKKYRLTDWRCRAFELVQSVTNIEIPAAAFGPSSLWFPHRLQRYEFALRAKRTMSPVATIFCKYADAKRRGGVSIRKAINANILVEAARLPILRRILSPERCLRLMGYGEARHMRFACIPNEGFDLRKSAHEETFLSGWSYGEPIGRWTDGPAAWAIFGVPGELASPIYLRLVVRPVHPSGPWGIRAKIWAGENTLWWTFTPDSSGDEVRALEGRLHRWQGRCVLPLHIVFAQAMDRKSLGRKDPDSRAIGLLLSRIEFAAPSNIPSFAGDLDLAKTDLADRILWSGWGAAEAAGRWTLGPEARLLLNVSHARRPPRNLRVNLVRIFDGEAGKPQHVEVLVNGKRACAQELSPAAPPSNFDVPLPADVEARMALIDVRFKIARPISPRQIGLSEDARALGMMVRSLELLT
jgi:hypothetical protein